MSFTDEEVAYLHSQRLGRIATVASDGQPDVVPVGYEFDGTYRYVGGLDPAKTRKFRNVRAGNAKVAVVIDDLVSADPWTPRYLRIYGTAELVDRRAGSGRPGTCGSRPPSGGAGTWPGVRSPTTARSAPGEPRTKLWLNKAPSRFAPRRSYPHGGVR
jgi:pyridoxamine 5'-phosphate oxidase family protein